MAEEVAVLGNDGPAAPGQLGDCPGGTSAVGPGRAGTGIGFAGVEKAVLGNVWPGHRTHTVVQLYRRFKVCESSLCS